MPVGYSMKLNVSYPSRNIKRGYNEYYKTEQEIRRVNFNISELIHVASASVGTSSCLSVHKIAEGR